MYNYIKIRILVIDYERETLYNDNIEISLTKAWYTKLFNIIFIRKHSRLLTEIFLFKIEFSIKFQSNGFPLTFVKTLYGKKKKKFYHNSYLITFAILFI